MKTDNDLMARKIGILKEFLPALLPKYMQVTHPQQYDYCINKLGCGAVLDYIGVPYRNQQLEVDHC